MSQRVTEESIILDLAFTICPVPLPTYYKRSVCPCHVHVCASYLTDGLVLITTGSKLVRWIYPSMTFVTLLLSYISAASGTDSGGN